MAYGHIAGQGVEVGFAEDLGDQAHVRVDIQGFSVGGGYAGAFLAPVLQGKEAKKRQMASVSVRSINSHNTTLVSGVVKRVLETGLDPFACHEDILGASQLRVNRVCTRSNAPGGISGFAAHPIVNKPGTSTGFPLPSPRPIA